MENVPERWKAAEELEPDELLLMQQAERAGEPTPRFETDAYIAAKVEALREAGFTEEADEIEAQAAEDAAADGKGGGQNLADMSVADHVKRLQAGNRPG